ncbi:hypothetical protein [Rufibacter roseus]|uniref:Collagen-like protein n=1 Tax=Rufibacter roseus TaxID=1567108 RepID=A0ABW2DR38_9BACT|nr:hypothetical protein [Rufibacter roseus]
MPRFKFSTSYRVASIFCLLLFVLVSVTALGQQQTRTLIIKKKEVYEVGPSNSLILDTLFMEDKAVLKFSSKGQGILIVKTAIIGDKCLISSRGGSRFHGEEGGNLSITIHFNSLESLTIDARGGDGRKGKDGIKDIPATPDKIEKITTTDHNGKPMVIVNRVPGLPAIDGTPPGKGGIGGSGGDIAFTYGAEGFIINFNNSKSKNSVTLLNSAGSKGADGRYAHVKQRREQLKSSEPEPEPDEDAMPKTTEPTNGNIILNQLQQAFK